MANPALMRPVLAIDPGKKTGWVCALVDTDTLKVTIDSWGEDDRTTFLGKANHLIGTLAGVIVVMEGWKPRGGALSFQPDALEIIGVIRWLCSMRTDIRLVIQDPASSHSVVKEARAKHPEVGRGGEGHAWMALGHLYAALPRLSYYVEDSE